MSKDEDDKPEDWLDRVEPVMKDKPGHKGHIDGYVIKDEYKRHRRQTPTKRNGDTKPNGV